MNLMPSFYDNSFRLLRLGIERCPWVSARVCAAAAPRGAGICRFSSLFLTATYRHTYRWKANDIVYNVCGE